jgi:maltokinase
VTAGVESLTGAQRRSLEDVVRTWSSQRRARVSTESSGGGGVEAVSLTGFEVLGNGSHRLLDLLADVDGRMAHVVVGLRRPGEETHPLRAVDDPVLGIYDDEQGLGVAVDAVRDADLAPLVLAALVADCDDPGTVTSVADDESVTVVNFGDRFTLTVFPWPVDGPHPGVAFLEALDEAGFNHVAAPLALWRRAGRDLGVVQEQLAGSADGWALALTSLRDLYGAGGPPEAAGGDFAPEARALGTMTARMHLALDRAFGRQTGEVREWVRAAEAAVRAGAPLLGDAGRTEEALRSLSSIDLKAPTIRTHGDFHLGRTARTDQGWVVADCMPGGVVPGSDRPVMRSPLGDVADMLWSLHHVASVAASERDPTGRAGLASLAQSWESRNRRAFLAGYLATPGIGGLVPPDREVVRKLAAVLELERAAGRSTAAHPTP